MTDRPTPRPGDHGDAPDYADLLRSPYDPDPGGPRDGPPAEGESDLPWVPAVIASVLGALAAGAFVVFAVVTGPDEPETEAASPPSSTSTTLVFEPSDGPPDGFTPITDEVSARVVASDTTDDATAIGVVTAVDGGIDASSVAPLDVAYWVLRTDDGDTVMRRQYRMKVGIGNVTVEFEPREGTGGAQLVPYLTLGVGSPEVRTLEFDTGLPRTVDPFTITVGDTVVSIDEFTFDASWGWLSWTSTGGPARVVPTITFVGTDDPSLDGENPTTLVTLDRQPFAFGTPARPLPTPFSFQGSESLVRAGEPVAGENLPTAIVVEFAVTVPDDIAEAVPLSIPGG